MMTHNAKMTQNVNSPQQTTSALTTGMSLLTFTVAGQLYGAPVDKVIRIIEMVTITHLPEAPPCIRGLINLHGKAVPVMDLHSRFGLPQSAYGLHTPIVLVDAAIESRASRPLGLVVDEVRQVVEVQVDSLATPAAPANAPAPYLIGVVKINRQMVLLLNIPALLRPSEQASLLAMMDEG